MRIVNKREFAIKFMHWVKVNIILGTTIFNCCKIFGNSSKIICKLILKGIYIKDWCCFFSVLDQQSEGYPFMREEVLSGQELS